MRGYSCVEKEVEEDRKQEGDERRREGPDIVSLKKRDELEMRTINRSLDFSFYKRYM